MGVGVKTAGTRQEQNVGAVFVAILVFYLPVTAAIQVRCVFVSGGYECGGRSRGKKPGNRARAQGLTHAVLSLM